jgi:predicted ATPase
MIKSFRVSGYKSLIDVVVDLDPLTVLIGRSGSGKTNFVEAIRFLRDYLHIRGDAASQYGGWPRILPVLSKRPYRLAFEVRFDAPGVPDDFTYRLVFQENGQIAQMPDVQARQNPLLFVEECLRLGDQVLFWQADGKWKKIPDVQSPPNAGVLAIGAVTGLSYGTLAYIVLTQNIGWYSFTDSVFTAEAPPGVGQRPPSASGLRDNGDGFLEAFNALHTNLLALLHPQQILAALQRLDKTIIALQQSRPNSDRIIMIHQVAGRPQSMEVWQESEGTRRFLACLLALYQTPPKQTLIFEEPEKGIHPGALQVLAEQFEACPEAYRGQVVLTTHSPQLLDHFPVENIRVVQIENYTTRIGVLQKEQQENVRENLMRPGELLTVDEANIEPAVSTTGG